MNKIKLHTLIIDDEELARKRLAKILLNYNEIEVVGEAKNGLEAIEMIDSIKPDLVFLDIKIPGANGFEVLERINHIPFIVFCTAFDDFAIKAFETNSVDYLVKPVEKERMNITIKKVLSLTSFPGRDRLMDTVRQLLETELQQETTVLPIKGSGKVIFVKLQDVTYLQASEKYIEVYTRNGEKHLMEQSLKYIESKLPSYFLRIHRSYLVNTNEIKEVQKYFGGKYVFIMDDIKRSKITSSRNFQQDIRKMLEL